MLTANGLLSQNTLHLKEGQKSPAAKIEDLSWLTGYWTGEAYGCYIDELWSRPHGNNMTGLYRTNKLK